MFGLSIFSPESMLSASDILEFFIRIVLSTVLGALVGLERTRRRKEAGIRTHCIVACSAAVFMIISKYAFLDAAVTAGAKVADPARIAAQVVSGISFLGAGVIFKNEGSIKGLTTAAGMWATAAIGMAIGAGLYWVGFIETVIIVIVQVVLHRFPIGDDSLTNQTITLTITKSTNILPDFEAFLKSFKGETIESHISASEDNICISAVVKLPEAIDYSDALKFMESHPGITGISV